MGIVDDLAVQKQVDWGVVVLLNVDQSAFLQTFQSEIAGLKAVKDCFLAAAAQKWELAQILRKELVLLVCQGSTAVSLGQILQVCGLLTIEVL
jgi:hypothetical protein